MTLVPCLEPMAKEEGPVLWEESIMQPVRLGFLPERELVAIQASGYAGGCERCELGPGSPVCHHLQCAGGLCCCEAWPRWHSLVAGLVQAFFSAGHASNPHYIFCLSLQPAPSGELPSHTPAQS